MEKKIRQRTTNNQHQLQELHPILARIYSARGILSAQDIERDLKSLLPFTSLKNIEETVRQLATSLQQQDRLLIIGDFDADGATSTALAVACLRAFGAQHISFLVPNRFEFGYGLTPEIVDVAKESLPDVIITVDNGVSSIAGVAHAKSLGIRVILTDHHLPGTEIPDTVMVNPNQAGDLFPSKNLAGVGVIFYVMMALRHHLREIKWFQTQHIAEPNLAQFLDLVALGTVADVVPLDRNNRILVHQGLRCIRAQKCRPGIRALIDVAGKNMSTLRAEDLGFAVGPRLNAAGRLDDMSLGIHCLLETDLQRARVMAKQLDTLNQERRSLEQTMKTQAFTVLDQVAFHSDEIPVGITLFDPSWHQGIVGLVAARVKEKYHRPSIAFAINETKPDELKGSARSIEGLHIRDALERVATLYPNLIQKFGGHAMAAGLSIFRKDFDLFASAFNQVVETLLDKEALNPFILTDGILAEDHLTFEVADLLREAGPFGQAFPEPCFEGRFRLLDQRIVGTRHLKMVLAHPEGVEQWDAIAFNIDTEKWPNAREHFIYAVYRLDINEFRGQQNLQLMIEQFEPA